MLQGDSDRKALSGIGYSCNEDQKTNEKFWFVV